MNYTIILIAIMAGLSFLGAIITNIISTKKDSYESKIRVIKINSLCWLMFRISVGLGIGFIGMQTVLNYLEQY